MPPRLKPNPRPVPKHRRLQYIYPFPTSGMGPLPEILLRQAGNAATAAQSAIDSIYSLDRLLVHFGHLLDLLQPSAPGKLAVRFPRTQTRLDDERAPVLGAWYPVGSRWFFRPLADQNKVLRARKKYGPFRGTYTEVGEVLVQIRELLRRRRALARMSIAAPRALQLTAAQARAFAIKAEADWTELLPIVQERRREAISLWHAVAEQKELSERLAYKPYYQEPDPAVPRTPISPPGRPRKAQGPKP